MDHPAPRITVLPPHRPVTAPLPAKRALAVEVRGEGGVEKLEEHIGKPLSKLTKAEADFWIERMTPEDRSAGGR